MNDQVRIPTLSLDATAYTKQQLIMPDVPQIALAGRSNVGKSSLINALAGRKALAKTSATPGKTRSINYYSLSSVQGFLVDLPGYGYAQCSHAERNKWAELIGFYLQNTPGLRALALLIDSRLTPQKLDIDLAVMAQDLTIPIIPILTKTDKCNKRELTACKKNWAAIFGPIPLFPTSATNRKGISELWQVLLDIISFSVDEDPEFDLIHSESNE